MAGKRLRNGGPGSDLVHRTETVWTIPLDSYSRGLTFYNKLIFSSHMRNNTVVNKFKIGDIVYAPKYMDRGIMRITSKGKILGSSGREGHEVEFVDEETGRRLWKGEAGETRFLSDDLDHLS